MIRRFILYNSKNQSWTFTDTDFKCFLSSPQGLGLNRNVVTTRYGYAQELSDIVETFPTPSGELKFYDTANESRYEKYNQFCRFIANEPLYLEYILPTTGSEASKTFRIKCVVSSLGKTESEENGVLSCPIQFCGLSFYEGMAIAMNGASTGTTVSLSLTNDSDFPVGVHFIASGTDMMNPSLTFTQDNEVYGEAKFIDSNGFSEVTIDSNDSRQRLELKQGGSVVANPLSYQDLSISNGSIYVTFVKLARGTSRLKYSVDSGSISSVGASFTPLYRSV